MKKYIKNLYLNESTNASFAMLIVFNIILCICSYYTSLQEYIGIAGGIITIASFFGFTISIYSKQQQFYHEQENNGRFIPEEMYIERDGWFQEIIDHKGIVILTGTSGIGKTYLLNQLMEFFTKKSICYYFEDSCYFKTLDQKYMNDKEYIILDQFERAFSFDNIDDNISVLNDLSDKKIIISIRSEFFGNVYKVLNFNKSIHTVWLDYNKNELDNIKIFLQNVSWNTKTQLEQSNLYSRILKDVEQRNLSMIQLSFLVRAIQYKGADYVEEQLDKYYHTEIIKNKEKVIYDYNDVIKEFYKEQIQECKDPDTAYLILYLLCLDHKGQYVNTMKDFQNISIMTEDKINEVMNFLCEEKWVKRVKPNPNIMRNWTEPCEIAHDYLQEQFEKICIEQIPSAIRSNIVYYNKNCQIQRESNEEKNLWRNYTNKICNKFLERKNKIYTNIWLLFVSLFIVIASGYLLNKPNKELDNIITLIAFNIMVGVSIYYMYNYYYHFLTIFNWRYCWGLFLAAPAIMFPFFCMNYWAVSLGMEIIIVGIIMFLISFRVRQTEKNFHLCG